MSTAVGTTAPVEVFPATQADSRVKGERRPIRQGSVPRSAAPEVEPRRIIRDLTVVGSGTLVCQVLGAGTSLVLRMLLEPSLVGVWSGLKQLLAYGNFAGLGVTKGASREIPALLAQERPEAAARSINLAFTFSLITSLVYMAGLLGAAGWAAFRSSGLLSNYWTVGLAVVGLLAVLQRYTSYSVTVLRAQQRFGLATRLGVLEAALTLGLATAGVWLFGLYGLFGATVAVTIAALAYLRRNGAGRFRFQWEGAEVRRLLAVGLPIVAAGCLFSVLRSMDRWVILASLPDAEYQLGCYSLALMVTNPLFGLGNMVGIVMYPRYQAYFGRTEDPLRVARLAARVMAFLAVGLGVVCGAVLLVGPTVLSWLLPAYRSGVPALVALVPGTLCLALSIPATHYLIAIDRQRWVVATAALVVGIELAAMHGAVRFGGGITGVAWAATVAAGVYLTVLLTVSLLRALPHRESLGLVGIIAGVLVALVAASIGIGIGTFV